MPIHLDYHLRILTYLLQSARKSACKWRLVEATLFSWRVENLTRVHAFSHCVTKGGQPQDVQNSGSFARVALAECSLEVLDISAKIFFW